MADAIKVTPELLAGAQSELDEGMKLLAAYKLAAWLARRNNGPGSRDTSAVALAEWCVGRLDWLIAAVARIRELEGVVAAHDAGTADALTVDELLAWMEFTGAVVRIVADGAVSVVPAPSGRCWVLHNGDVTGGPFKSLHEALLAAKALAAGKAVQP